MDPSPTPAEPKRRRWFAFGTRSLLLVVTALAVWIGIVAQRVRTQAEAVRAIQAAGGAVSYDYQVDEEFALFDLEPEYTEPHGPAWLRAWIGDDYFRTAVVVDCRNYDAYHREGEPREFPRVLSVELVETVGRLSRLRRLTLNDLDFASGAAASLDRLTCLEFLDVASTNFSNDDLAALANLTSLEYLDLRATKVDGRGAAHLRRLVNLRSLDVSLTDLNDGGLEVIGHLPKVERLSLRATFVTEDGLRFLSQSRFLRELDLREIGLTRAGLAHVCQVPNLEELNLGCNYAIGDEDLALLRSMKSLRSLVLHQTRCSLEGVNQLRRDLPGCNVERW